MPHNKANHVSGVVCEVLLWVGGRFLMPQMWGIGYFRKKAWKSHYIIYCVIDMYYIIYCIIDMCSPGYIFVSHLLHRPGPKPVLSLTKAPGLYQNPFCQLTEPAYTWPKPVLSLTKSHALPRKSILSIDKTLLHLAQNSFVIDKRLPVLAWGPFCQLTKSSHTWPPNKLCH